jgi:hypothetical protein
MEPDIYKETEMSSTNVEIESERGSQSEIGTCVQDLLARKGYAPAGAH